MENQHGDAGPGAVIDDPDQQVSADEAAALAVTLEGGAGSGSWYWTSMLNFSQSGSSSTHTSAGQVAASQFAGSPPSSSSVHMMSNNLNNNNTINSSNNQAAADHNLPLQLDSILASNAATVCSDPAEHAVWGQEFLSGSIGETEAISMHTCADDGLQELLYPRSVRELLLEQSPSWDLLQQVAIPKSFGLPLVPEVAPAAAAHMHGLLHSDVHKPAHIQGLPYSHDERLCSSTACSTLSHNTQHLSAGATAAAHHQQQHQQQESTQAGRTLHAPLSNLLLPQFDHTRVKQENSLPQLNPMTVSSLANPSPTSMHSLLLQHQQQQHSLRLISNSPDHASLLNEGAMAALNALDIKPNKQLLNNTWPNSPSPISHFSKSPSSLEFIGMQPSRVSVDPQDDLNLWNSLKEQQYGPSCQLGGESTGFAATSPTLSSLMGQDACFFQHDNHRHHHHHELMQQAAMQAQQHAPSAGVRDLQTNVPNSPLHRYLSQSQLPLQVGLKKGRAHLEGGNVNILEEGRDMKGAANNCHDDYAVKRPHHEPQQQQQQQQSALASTSSFKSQPVRKEKLGDRITTLQQLVSPFGKTDTASVLLEAIGCIKFLQEQVQTLSSSYLKSTKNPTPNVDKSQSEEDAKPDLRSKGLCLVPLSCTMQVANDNGADYWYGGTFR